MGKMGKFKINKVENNKILMNKKMVKQYQVLNNYNYFINTKFEYIFKQKMKIKNKQIEQIKITKMK